MENVRFEAQYPVEGLLCHGCRLVPPMFERAVAYAVDQDELREMIHLLKYERISGVAKMLGAQLAEAILTLRGAAGRELVVMPVPLFPAKQRQRGYNQAELLADAAVAALRRLDPGWKLLRMDGVLTRRRDTESQFALTPRGRRRNLDGAFAVDASRLRAGCEVLLIDDIFTSGATARECWCGEGLGCYVVAGPGGRCCVVGRPCDRCGAGIWVEQRKTKCWVRQVELRFFKRKRRI